MFPLIWSVGLASFICLVEETLEMVYQDNHDLSNHGNNRFRKFRKDQSIKKNGNTDLKILMVWREITIADVLINNHKYSNSVTYTILSA